MNLVGALIDFIKIGLGEGLSTPRIRRTPLNFMQKFEKIQKILKNTENSEKFKKFKNIWKNSKNV